MSAIVVDDAFRARVDAIPISDHAERLKERYFKEAPGVSAARIKLALKANKETEADHIETRRARILAAILDGIPVVIHDDELTAGSQTEFFRGACPNIDWDGEYFAKLLETQDGQVPFGGLTTYGRFSKEVAEVWGEASSYFRGRTPAEAAKKTMRAIWGSWYDDVVEARALSPAYEGNPYNPGIPYWEKLLSQGLRGIIREAEQAMQRFAETDNDDPEKVHFWQAVIVTCEATINFARRYSQLARELAAEAENAMRRDELEEIARLCEWVPENPARTFHEVIQSIRLVDLALCLENTRKTPDLGRMDQYLYPYFKRDIAEGRLTLEKAADLIADFVSYVGRQEEILGGSLAEVHQATTITHITLGGVTREGDDATNELTYLFLHVLGVLGYAEPHATLRIHRDTPHWLLMKALDNNRKVNGIPMYVNDKHVIDELVRRGVTVEEARDWGMVGCSQPVTSMQAHYKPVFINSVMALELALHKGVCRMTGKQIGVATGDPLSFETFDAVYQAFKTQHEFMVQRLLRAARLVHRETTLRWRQPLRSALDPACIKNGRSHLVGGCDGYPNWYVKDRALVDLADSLMAIKHLVFNEQKLTMAELLEALDSNFEGPRGEDIRQMCLAAPKFGNDVDEVDYMVRDVAKFSAGLILSEKNAFGWPWAIQRNGVAWHYSAGKKIGALPNGRKAGTPLYDGALSPQAGADKYGPTAVLNSVLKADFVESAVPILNQKFPLGMVNSPENMEKIASLTQAFVDNGGIHIQFNMVDRQTLLEAKKHPEQYPSLVVRVAGYSAYFVTLMPEVQDEIIARTEQVI